MGFFSWSAPLFHLVGDRWRPETLAVIAQRLEPYVGSGGAILDLGGGTGALAARLADVTGATVTVLDPSPAMRRYLPKRADVKGMAGSAEDMPLDDAEFDACVVSDAFHHFRDQDAAVAEMTRVVRPGGGILILEFDPATVLTRPLRLVERMVGEPATFLTQTAMCDLMRRHDVDGTCEPDSRVGYHFIGTVQPREGGRAAHE